MSFKKAAYLLPFTLLALNTAFAVPLIVNDRANSDGISMQIVGETSVCFFAPDPDKYRDKDKGYLNNRFIEKELEKHLQLFITNNSTSDCSASVEKEIRWRSAAKLTISAADYIVIKAPIRGENGSLELSSQKVDIGSIDHLICKSIVIKSNTVTIKGEKASQEELELLKTKNVTFEPFNNSSNQ